MAIRDKKELCNMMSSERRWGKSPSGIWSEACCLLRRTKWRGIAWNASTCGHRCRPADAQWKGVASNASPDDYSWPV